ncbi:MAG: hypothetical protein ABI891_09885 [Acidobacteriota bacterium]
MTGTGEMAASSAEAAGKVEPLQLRFTGTFFGIFGEASKDSLGFSVTIDGEPIFFNAEAENEVWPTSIAKSEGGRHFFWHVISTGLTPAPHSVKILPVIADKLDTGELRIGSICVAGPAGDSSQSVTASARSY